MDNTPDYRAQAEQMFGKLLQTESGGRHYAKDGSVLTSPAGALGAAQLMPATARELGVDPNDPEQNIEGGKRYLTQQLERFGGDPRKALAAYNAGPNRVANLVARHGEEWERFLPEETAGYLSKQLGTEGAYQARPFLNHAPRPIESLTTDEMFELEKRLHDERVKVANRLSAAGLINEARKAEWTFGLDDRINDHPFNPDPSYRMTTELWEELSHGTGTEEHETLSRYLDDATSEAHARYLKDKYDGFKEREQNIAAHGLTGVGARILAGFTDPALWGIVLASGGLGLPELVAARATGVARAVRLGLLTTAEQAPLEAYKLSQRDWYTAANSAWVLGASFGFGSLMGMKMHPDLQSEGRRLMRDADGAAGLPHDPVTSATAPDYMATSAGAAQHLSVDEAGLRAWQADVVARLESEMTPTEAFASGLRFDMHADMLSSPSLVVRKLAGLGEDSTGLMGGEVSTIGVTEMIALELRRRTADYARVAEASFSGWMKAGNRSAWSRMFGDAREEFFEEVGKAIRHPSGVYTGDTFVNTVADDLRARFRDLLAYGKAKGIKGFDQIAPNDQYFTRIWNAVSLHELRAKFGDAGPIQLVKTAILSGSRGVADDEAERLAKAYLHAIDKRFYSHGERYTLELDSETRDHLFEGMQEYFRAHNLPVEEGKVRALIDRYVDVSGEGRHARAQYRLNMDETAVAMLRGEHGEDVKVPVTALFQNNAEAVYLQYLNQVVRSGHMTEFLRKAFPVEVRDDLGNAVGTAAPSWGRVMDLAGNDLRTSGLNHKEIQAKLGLIDQMYRTVMGMPHRTPTKVTVGARMFRKYSFSTLMNNMGLAQLGDTGNIPAQTGLKAAMQHAPILRHLLGTGGSPAFYKELEQVWAIGTDRIISLTNRSFENHGTLFPSRPRLEQKIEQGLDTLGRGTARLSGMGVVLAEQQKWAVAAAVTRFMDHAHGGKKLSSVLLRNLGLDEEMAARVMEQMRSTSVSVEGALGRKVKELNLGKWKDNEAREAFVFGINRWSRRMVQENDPAQYAQWMSNDMATLMLQFRRFMVGAWTKQFLGGAQLAKHGDWSGIVGWIYALINGALLYTAGVHLTSAGRSDADRYRENYLAPAEVAVGALSKAGFSTILPMAGTSVWNVLAPKDYQYGGAARTTGLGTDLLSGLVPIAVANNLSTGAGGLKDAVYGSNTVSQAEARALKALIPWSNQMVLTGFFNHMISDLPKKDR